MRGFWVFLICFMLSIRVGGQNLSDLSFGSQNELDIMTWNLEWFPKNGASTADSVAQVIRALGMDVVACQEINDTTLFKTAVESIEGYKTFFGTGWHAGLAFAYNSNTVVLQDAYKLFEASPFWNIFPRAPLVLEIWFEGELVYIINNHLKCCGDGFLELGNSDDEENRRYLASNQLRNYIQANLPDARVIVLGDLNDELTDPYNHNVFRNILSDPDHFVFADQAIAEGDPSTWSYPSWPSHLDHILVTDEWMSALDAPTFTIQTLPLADYLPAGFFEYYSTISDHFPVAMKIQVDPVLLNQVEIDDKSVGYSYPNPASTFLYIHSEISHTDAVFRLLDARGVVTQQIELVPGSADLSIAVKALPAGLYIAQWWESGRLVKASTVSIIH
jgi:endonuclease/exonuclease/phosphatase family metal-dependent hydrolase